MAGSSTAGTFATGGHENDLKVWQIDNLEKPVFCAKNVGIFKKIKIPYTDLFVHRLLSLFGSRQTECIS